MVQWDLGGEEGRVLGAVGPVEVVVGQVEGHNLEEGGLEVRVQVAVGQTDQGRERGEEACHHGLEDQKAVEGGPVQVEVLVGQVGREDQEGDVEDPASHLQKSTRNRP